MFSVFLSHTKADKKKLKIHSKDPKPPKLYAPPHKKSCPRRCFSSLLKWTTYLLIAYVSLSIGYGVYIRTLRPPTSWEEYKNEWALITGASYGIGEGFARGLAKRGVNVILVARNEEKLEALQKDILTKYPKIKVKTIAVDLAKNGYLEKIMSEIKKLNVSVLINNVGQIKDQLLHGRKLLKKSLYCQV